MSKVNRIDRQMRKAEKKPEPQRTTIAHILDKYKIRRWDYLLLGDGSGSTWGRATGWGCLLICARTGDRRPFYGTCNDGTVNFAELMAYLQPLDYINSKRSSGKSTIVHIITDSEYVAKNTDRMTPEKNAGLIAAINAYRRKGIITTFHWMRRNSHPLTEIVDQLSKDARKLVKRHQEQTLADLLQSINRVQDDDD